MLIGGFDGIWKVRSSCALGAVGGCHWLGLPVTCGHLPSGRSTANGAYGDGSRLGFWTIDG